jgi:hypothetical protein|tara:strand:+ start:3513 stop:3728 length:216 start_codon:yes stop_codon:yes gene_type:complete
MQVEFLVNGGVSLLLVPENEMEESMLKQMMKQDNDLTQIRSNVIVLNKTFRSGVLIHSKSNKLDEDKSKTM